MAVRHTIPRPWGPLATVLPFRRRGEPSKGRKPGRTAADGRPRTDNPPRRSTFAAQHEENEMSGRDGTRHVSTIAEECDAPAPWPWPSRSRRGWRPTASSRPVLVVPPTPVREEIAMHKVWDHIESISSRDPIYCAEKAPLAEVVSALWQRGVGLLLVGDCHHLQGVISERDVVSALARGLDPDATSAADVMTSDLITVRPLDSVHDAAAVMLDLDIRHVPVVDHLGTVTGIVSLRDVLRPLMIDALSAG